MLTPKRPSDLFAAALRILTMELREPIVQRLEQTYGKDCLELGILPALPEYALHKSREWSRQELLASEDPVIWLKLLLRNWRQAFEQVLGTDLEKEVLNLHQLRNRDAHSNGLSENEAAAGISTVGRLLTAFDRPNSEAFQALALECRLFGWDVNQAAKSIPAVTSLPVRSFMPAPTTAHELVSNLIEVQNRTPADMFRGRECPAHEKWIFTNSVDGEYLIRTDHRRRPWPSYWRYDRLIKVQLGPQAIHLNLATDYEPEERNRLRSLTVSVHAQIQVRDQTEAVRRIAFEAEREAANFMQLLGRAILAELSNSQLQRNRGHGRYTAAEKIAGAASINEVEIPADSPFQLLRLLDVTFGDQAYVQQSRRLDVIEQEAEIKVRTIQAEETVFSAAGSFVRAQQERELEREMHEGTRESIRMTVADLPRRLHQQNVITAMRQLKELQLNDSEMLLYAGQLDHDSLRLILESRRIAAKDNDGQLAKFIRICEGLLTAVRPQNHYH